MNKKTLLKIILACLAIVVVIFGWLLSATKVDNKIDKSRVPKVDPYSLDKTQLKEVKNGKLSWLLDVEGLVFDKKRNVNMLKGIKGEFHREDGSIVYVTADEGEADSRSKNVTLTKNPKGVLSTGGTVTGDRITWIDKTQVIIVQGKARIVKDDMIATANKATMWTKDDKAKLEGKAKVEKGVKYDDKKQKP